MQTNGQTMFDRAFAYAQRHRTAALILLGVLTVVAGYFAAQTRIDMGTYTLLPTKDPVFSDFRKISAEFGGFDNLIIKVSSEDDGSGEAYVRTLAKEFAGLDGMVRSVDAIFPMDYFETKAPYYMSDESFRQLHDTLVQNPGLIQILAREDNLQLLQASLNNEDLQRLEREAKNLSTLKGSSETNMSLPPGVEIRDGFYRLKATGEFLMFLRPTNPNHDMTYFTNMVRAVEGAIDSVHAPDGASVQLAGMAKMMEEQQSQLNTRLAIASALALLGVVLLFTLAYGRVSSSLLAVAPVLVGIVWTLGLNQLVIGRLNLVTSMFAVIMLGLGVDFSIHFLTPVFARAKPDERIGEDVVPVIKAYFRSILAGAVTTAVAFFALMTSKFKGLKELGFVAGVGILFSFLAVLLFMILVVPRVRLRKVRTRSADGLWSGLFRLVRRLRWVIVVVLLAVLALPLVTFRDVRFNYNAFSLLPDIPSVRTQEDLIDETGISLEYSILKSTSIDEARSLATSLRNLPEVAYVDSVTALIPEAQDKRVTAIQEMAAATVSPALLDRAVAALAAIRNRQTGASATDNFASRNADLGPLLRDFAQSINQLAREGKNGTVTVANLPPSIREKYLSPKGSIATYAYGYPNSWEEDQMKSLVSALSATNDEVSGTPFMWEKIVDYLKSDLISGSLLVFALLILIVTLDFRDLRSVLMVLVPVTGGAALLLTTMALAGIKFNAANIAAVPLIIGIGIDDGIHMVHKYLGQARGDVRQVLTTTGKSVLVTSLTTMIGFGSLHFVGDPLVSGLGELLFLGVFYCLAISLLALPVLMWFDSRRRFPATAAVEVGQRPGGRPA